MGEETERKGRMTTGAEREAARQLWERSFNLLFQADGAHVRVCALSLTSYRLL